MAISNFLLSIADVKGDSKEKDGWIDLETWSYGLLSPADPVTKQALGHLQVGDFLITKGIDKASPILIDFCKKNKLISSVKMECREMKANGMSKEYFVVELKNARIRSVNTKVAGPRVSPVEAVAISFQHVSWTFVDGGISTEFDTTSGT